MAINQLFINKPPIDILVKIALFFGIDLHNLESNNTFTKQELVDMNLKDNYTIIINLLDEYYLNCKKKIYFDNINDKKCITILRQLLKIHNYSLKSTEKYCNSTKYVMYSIIYNKIDSTEAIDGIINFD
jgi:hypothetical protein